MMRDGPGWGDDGLMLLMERVSKTGMGPRVRAVSVHSYWVAKHVSWKAGLAGYQKGGLEKAVERKGRWHHLCWCSHGYHVGSLHVLIPSS